MTKTLILAALAATSLVQPVLAEPITQTVVVEHQDLDLATPGGAKTLQHRVWRAVVAVCGTTSEFDVAGKNDIRQCRRDTLQAASAKADQVIAGASRGEPVRVASIRK
ncbi:UrcA family protein [Sphingopyxis sp. H050]|jgi:UrcA family protein|uniref:UrcA family protein n=1 Tax=Sphingopyxis sp. H050 TaxID=1759072 RepID=UPI0007376EE3|nr:UrcA family protein [Sphingopyxis sp. H050]KTE22894.1 UrcA family protein [Sphingopyxis sp. H050]